MSYLENNMKLLKARYPDTWEKISALEGMLNHDLIQLVPSKKGILNLQVGDIFIHDKNNPKQEAINIINKQVNIDEHSEILFYGIGLGYHIHDFIQKYPHKPFTIYEPCPEILYQFLCLTDLNQMPENLLKNIYLQTQSTDIELFCSAFVQTIGKSGMVIDLPAYKKIFPEKSRDFFTVFESHIKERSIAVNTLSAFEKRWTLNSTKNFIEILNSPNVLLEKKNYFTNKPAIMVASGPSLEDEIENLRKIKEEGLAYIFSVGTALNALIRHDVYPHAACTYDPTEKNQIICKEVVERGIHTIPLIFGSTVAYETLEKYPGPKMHMLISQDSLAAYYLRPRDGGLAEAVHDATTIAVITIQLLAKLGFSPIILVGQNLAYRDNKVYAAGATFHPPMVSEQILDDAALIKDVNGNPVQSSDSFIRMRQQFEYYLSNYKSLNVINTTIQGAHIEGTAFQSLDDLIRDQLHDQIVEENWMECNSCSYDMKFVNKQRKMMEQALEKVSALLIKCKNDLDKINELADCHDAAMIGQSYDQFNSSMDELRNNPFFSTFITPMNRVELEFLMLAVPTISAEREPIYKAKMMDEIFRSYLLHCEQDIIEISPLFYTMNTAIEAKYIHQKAAQIKLLLIEGDGIITDGSVYYTTSGEAFKKFHNQDRIGTLRLLENGISVQLVNLEDDPILNHAARDFFINTDYAGLDKKEIITKLLNQGLHMEEIAIFFNNKHDLSLFSAPGLSFAASDASPELKNSVDYVFEVNYGQGVILAAADLITSD